MAAVLIASADGGLRTLAARELSDSGRESCFAADAFEALALLKARDFSAAVVDHALPAPGGRALLERLFAEERCRYLPVLAVLGAGDSPAEPRAPAGAAVEFLARPLSVLALNAALARLLAAQPAERDGAAPAAAATGPDRAAELGGLCHALNNHLAVMMGQLELIAGRHPDLPPDLLRRLGEIRGSAEGMRGLIRQAAPRAPRKVREA